MANGNALLLLHGFTNTHRAWARLLNQGVADHFRVLAPDLRGHGDASGVRPVDLSSVLEDVDALAPERFTLLGYSQGARIALHAALDPRIAPRVQRLILLSGSPGIADPHERARRRAAEEALAREIEASTIEAFALRWAQLPVLGGLSAELSREVQEDRLHNTPSGLAAALRGLGTGALAPLWDRLGELELGTTLVAGERDTKFTLLARQMAARVPRAEVTIIAGAGHQVHLEAPDQVAAALRSPVPQTGVTEPSGGIPVHQPGPEPRSR